MYVCIKNLQLLICQKQPPQKLAHMRIEIVKL